MYGNTPRNCNLFPYYVYIIIQECAQLRFSALAQSVLITAGWGWANNNYWWEGVWIAMIICTSGDAPDSCKWVGLRPTPFQESSDFNTWNLVFSIFLSFYHILTCGRPRLHWRCHSDCVVKSQLEPWDHPQNLGWPKLGYTFPWIVRKRAIPKIQFNWIWNHN
jgi:hypothetical protein